jgi:hypothetical protein
MRPLPPHLPTDLLTEPRDRRDTGAAAPALLPLIEAGGGGEDLGAALVRLARMAAAVHMAAAAGTGAPGQGVGR